MNDLRQSWVLAQHALHGSLEHTACRVVMSALMKLAGGSPTFSHELNVDAFLRQVGLAESAQGRLNSLGCLDLLSSSTRVKHAGCLFAKRQH